MTTIQPMRTLVVRTPYAYSFEDMHPCRMTQKPSETGYREDDTAGEVHSKEKQQTYMELMFVRYFDLSPEDRAICIGVEKHKAGIAEYKKVRKRLNDGWKSLRSKSFGNSSFMSELAKHVVTLHDFKAYVFNLARNERLHAIAPANETISKRTRRLALVASYRASKEDHINRLQKSREAAVRYADAALRHIEEQEILKPSKKYKASDNPQIIRAMRDLQFYRDNNQPWEPSLEQSYTDPEDVPLLKLMYSAKNIRVQQKVWEAEWNKDIATCMLANVRDTIDIPATLEEAEDYYQAMFTFMCHDIWRFIGGIQDENVVLTKALREIRSHNIETKMSSEENRIKWVYPNIAGVNELFDDKPGLDWLRMPKSSSNQSSKRARCPVLSGFQFGKKKQREHRFDLMHGRELLPDEGIGHVCSADWIAGTCY